MLAGEECGVESVSKQMGNIESEVKSITKSLNTLQGYLNQICKVKQIIKDLLFNSYSHNLIIFLFDHKMI